MIFLIHHIRKIVLAVSILLWLTILFGVNQAYSSPSLQQIRHVQFFALTALTYLYLALIASPLFAAFPNLSFKPIYIRARRAIGVSAFFFALTHATFAFFGSLGGFGGLAYLPNNYLIAISFSFLALVILGLMAATSFDYMVKKLGVRWKLLHRFVYLATLLITIHALMLGTHFIDLSALVPKIFFVALSVLLILEAIRFDKFIASRFTTLPRFGLGMLLVIGFLIFASTYLKPAGDGSNTSLGIHAQHVQVAEQVQQGNTSNSNFPNIPGVTGDRTLRFNVNFEHPERITAGNDTPLEFSVHYASNGAPEFLFEKPFAEAMHLIIVDQSLTYFNHIHPKQSQGTFAVTTQFPKPGSYYLYIDFQPVGAIEQQFTFKIDVQGSGVSVAKPEVDQNLTKTFGDYLVTLSHEADLKASQLSVGRQLITFTLKDAKTKQELKNLKPYLNAFGHMVMIDRDDYQYVHVHPANLIPPRPTDTTGPKVEFMPLGLYRPISPGFYRVFVQFNPDGKLFTADFTIEVGQ